MYATPCKTLVFSFHWKRVKLSGVFYRTVLKDNPVFKASWTGIYNSRSDNFLKDRLIVTVHRFTLSRGSLNPFFLYSTWAGTIQCNMKQPWQYLPLLLLLPPTLGLQSTCHQLIPLSMYVWDAATDPWRNDDVASSMLTPSELCKVVPNNYRLLS